MGSGQRSAGAEPEYNGCSSQRTVDGRLHSWLRPCDANSAADGNGDTCSADAGANCGPTDCYRRTADANTTGATASESAGADGRRRVRRRLRIGRTGFALNCGC